MAEGHLSFRRSSAE